jgi:hypothetical protein
MYMDYGRIIKKNKPNVELFYAYKNRSIELLHELKQQLLIQI